MPALAGCDTSERSAQSSDIRLRRRGRVRRPVVDGPPAGRPSPTTRRPRPSRSRQLRRFNATQPRSPWMWRHAEARILAERVPVLRVGHEMHRASERVPPWPRGRVLAIEDGKPLRANAEQRPTLELRLLGFGKAETDAPNPRQVAGVVRSIRAQCSLSRLAAGRPMVVRYARRFIIFGWKVRCG